MTITPDLLAPPAPPLARRRIAARVTGTVQGVGFRPYVYRLAQSLHLDGLVRNDAHGVYVEAEGAEAAVQEFLARLPTEAPVLAAVDAVQVRELSPSGQLGFAVVQSERSDGADTFVVPDAATCDACLRELFDPADRRYRYPFINCTHCGPRFTIVRGVPYDRPFTTMASFAMCDACRAEYEDPGDRRFHAQPNACPVCGPRARLIDASGAPASLGQSRDALEATARALSAGAIVAIKGLGGYHLACRAADADAVARLRGRKHRDDKPFALMVPHLEAAGTLVYLDAAEEALLSSRARPIVLARRRPGAAVAGGVAPGHRDLGIVLPYTPLHHLLLADAGVPLVMTSGNRSDEPIAFRDGDALERLGGIADLFLVHDRPIETRTDDSVARVVTIAGHRQTLMLRRSRGYVPAPLALPDRAPRPLLATGGQLKNTFCLVRDDRAFVGPHIGDLENLETLRSFATGIEHLSALFDTTPRAVAYDLHPDYLATGYALDRARLDGWDAAGVQHHHAHLAACLAEHGERGPAIGVIFDGTGYGLDGTIWGGELLLGDLGACERVGHLWPVRMPGGERAIREPWRMACAWLVACGDTPEIPPMPATMRGCVDDARWRGVARLARADARSPVTTSAGRLLDAVSAMCGIRHRVSYEGQAAIELEMRARADLDECYPLPVISSDGPLVLDARELVRAVRDDVARGRPVEEIAACALGGLSYAAVRACLMASRSSGVTTVVLSGGVFQNMLMLERTAARLAREGLRVLVPERLPPNDGGLAYGQAAILSHRMQQRTAEIPSCASPSPGR